ncbi:carboxymuconolactone decarboxylase family protein [Microbacterium sp. zg.B48]|uniref:carboxymuconolactone decarboxylase family protein n=1 Tax=unclassified Microbacterium TaxID=2609290 RepID=UPI00214B0B47|nr:MULTISPECIES: carboxymuconolactone decarboxylase family protein [unclassified Microbacterium]MCR2764694.1 carboxymuconolactone decarboxylase family protein [Microbacterium sp. zg.B48]MCR2810169.1 carboxymuconolactone decarboxylase family protein [Microbacterium sp. zg.B185]WIM19997.1 carboxymuconolactone decarboxylase family protein [Microbacterium sp. zg-B185]
MSELARVHLSKSAPEAYKTLSAFSKTVGGIADDAGIDARLRELVQIHVSQLNGCAYCVRVHLERAEKAGVTADTIAQLPVWRESGVFTERERAGLELAESFTFVSDEGIPDEVYNRVGGILTESEYVALSWILVAINAFNRVAIAGRYSVPSREDMAGEDRDAASGAVW